MVPASSVVKFVSLFSGVGGLDLGLERAGHECVLQVEIDEFCQKVLTKHWPNVKRISNVKEVTADDCKEATAIVGGFPCQPVSTAGKREAQDDPRWLWPEFLRLITGVQPRYVIVENVPGLLSAGMGGVLGDLSALGYDAEWYRVAAETVGAPHLRWRIFILAHTNNSARSTEQGEQQEIRPNITGGSGTSWLTDLANTTGERPQGPEELVNTGNPAEKGSREATESLYGRLRSQWETEPDVGRVADGVPARMDRLRALGNAVVPQVAELIGHRLMELERKGERNDW